MAPQEHENIDAYRFKGEILNFSQEPGAGGAALLTGGGALAGFNTGGA